VITRASIAFIALNLLSKTAEGFVDCPCDGARELIICDWALIAGLVQVCRCNAHQDEETCRASPSPPSVAISDHASFAGKRWPSLALACSQAKHAMRYSGSPLSKQKHIMHS